MRIAPHAMLTLIAQDFIKKSRLALLKAARDPQQGDLSIIFHVVKPFEAYVDIVYYYYCHCHSQ